MNFLTSKTEDLFFQPTRARARGTGSLHLAHNIQEIENRTHLERNHLGIEWVAIVKTTYSK